MLDRPILKKLQEIVGKEHVHSSPEELRLYAYDATPAAELVEPDAVMFPGSAKEITELLVLANRVPFPVVPRGAGTNLTGGARPVHGGIVVSTQRMDRVLRIDADNLQVVAQPGVVTKDLQDQVEVQGLFYPPDPQSKESCTIGGNLAENAGGPRAVKYGVTRQYVLGLEVVLPTGRLVRLGARTLKSVVGYDLVSLLVGSEGTLGVITEATLRLLPAPEARGTLLAVFDRVEEAVAAVVATFRARVLPSAIEFMDRETIRCVEQYASAGLPTDASAVLVLEVDGGPTEVERSACRVREVMQQGGARLVRVAVAEEEAEGLWKARQAVGPSLARIAPIKVNEDIVVPLTRLPEAVGGIHKIADEHRVRCACFGHVGDGNLHVNFLAQPSDLDELRRVERAVGEVFALVVSLQGSITGEHGVGTTKQPYITLELSPDVLEAMLQVKRALDPLGIMNPGKIFPPLGAGARVRPEEAGHGTESYR